MLWLTVLFFLQTGQALTHCNETVKKLTMCSLVEVYEQGMPPLETDGPLMVINSVTLFSLAELNEDQSSISLTVLLAMVWNDTRLALKSNNPNE